MNIVLLIILGVSLLYEQSVQALVVGSNSVVSVVTTCTVFPSSDTNNTILGFTWLKGGFTLADATTSCTYDALYPISGTVDLNGGTLYLAQDLVLANPTDLKGLGTIIGNGHSIEFCESVTALPADLKTIKDLNVFFDGDIELLGGLTVQGNCLINCTGNGLRLGENVIVKIDENSTLEVQDAILKNVNNNIGCVSNTSHFVIQNIVACLEGDCRFLYGDLTIQNSCKITGANTLWYDSELPFLVDYESTLILDGGMTFKCGRKSMTAAQPLKFYDNSSKISCGECTIHITATGLTLTRGRFEIGKNVTIECDATDTTHGIILGDGNLAENDITVYLGVGSLTTFDGPMVYNNVQPGLFYSAGPSASFIRRLNSPFYLAKTCIHPASQVIFEVVGDAYAPTTLSDTATLYYNNMHMVIPGYNEATYYATRTPDYLCLLNGSQFMYMTSGVFPYPIWVSGKNNMLSGNGTLTGAIILLDSNSQLFLSLSGAIHNSINLNGGTITLINDVSLACEECFGSSGIIDLGEYTMKFDYVKNDYSRANNFDCSMTWSGNNGFISMTDNTTLLSTWTIKGYVTIDGNWNSLSLADGGKLVLDKGAHLTLRNMRLNFIGAGDLRCLDDRGVLVLDNVHWVQNEDFEFTPGSLIFKNNVSMSGQGSVFTYKSTQAATIYYDSSLDLDYRFTFSYAPSDGSDKLLEFKDFSSKLSLSKATFYITPGLCMTKGQLLIKDDSTVYALGKGLTFGDQTSANDMTLIFDNRYVLTVAQGTLSYKNTVTDSLQMNMDAVIEMGESTQLNVYENITLGHGAIMFDRNAVCTITEGKQIIGSLFGSYTYTVTGKQIGS